MLEVDLDIESWQLWDGQNMRLCSDYVPLVLGRERFQPFAVRREVCQPWNTRMCKAGRAGFAVLVCGSLIISWIFLYLEML